VVVLVYIPTNSVRGFLFPRILANTCWWCFQHILDPDRLQLIHRGGGRLPRLTHDRKVGKPKIPGVYV
jgi:hypothetical protein